MNFSSIFSQIKERFSYGKQVNPARDWLILLGLWLIIFAGIVLWSIWAFDTVAQGGTLGAPASSAPEVFSQSSLDAIRAIFTDRAAEEAKYTTGVYRFADPSQ